MATIRIFYVESGIVSETSALPGIHSGTAYW